MEAVYFKKSEARVTRVVAEDWVELEVPGYPQRFAVDLGDTASVGPAPLTTLSAQEGSKGDLYLSPAFLGTHGIVPDSAVIKWPDRGGGSYAEQWRAWSTFQRLDESGPVARSLRAIRDEVKGGSLTACAAQLAAGETARARGTLSDLALGSSKATRSARALLAPGDRADRERITAILQAALVGILAEAC